MAASSSSSKAKAAKPAEEEEDVVDQLDALGRKMWDKDFYAEKAKNNIMFGPERIGKRKDPVIPLPASQRTFLQQRKSDLNLDKHLGEHRVVTHHTIKPMQGGYWCSVCECLLKDSATYLDHVNGRRHNRNLGMNMKVEKIGVDRVREKIQSLKKGGDEAAAPEDIAARIQALEDDEQAKKLRKKEKKRKKKKGPGEGDEDEPAQKKQKGEDDDDVTGDEAAPADAGKDGDDDEDGDEEEETEEMKMLKMMGLPTGFG